MFTCPHCHSDDTENHFRPMSGLIQSGLPEYDYRCDYIICKTCDKRTMLGDLLDNENNTKMEDNYV